MGKEQIHSSSEGKPDAPLVIVGSNTLGSDQENSISTPEDGEFHRYSDLLRGFFDKLNRWNEIFHTEQYRRDPNLSVNEPDYGRYWDFQVLQAPTGLVINPLDPHEPLASYMETKPDRILEMTQIIWNNDPEYQLFNIEFRLYPGLTGKRLMVDPDGKSLEQVRIVISSDLTISMRDIKISTERLGEEPRRVGNFRYANYRFRGNTLRVSHKYMYHDVMTDEMATNLVNAIDSLIPQATPQLPEPQTAGE